LQGLRLDSDAAVPLAVLLLSHEVDDGPHGVRGWRQSESVEHSWQEGSRDRGISRAALAGTETLRRSLLDWLNDMRLVHAGAPA
jgi:hypothetical protein